MKKQTIALALAAVVAASVSTVAMADDTSAVANAWNQFNVNNLYVGGNVGYSTVAKTTDTDGFGWNVHSGYNFTPMWAAEVGYNQAPNKTFDMFGDSGNYAIDVAGKLTLPLQLTNYSVFGKAGFAYENHYKSTSNSDAGVVGYFGAGVNYQLQQNIGLVAEVDTTAFGGASEPMMTFFSVGANYNF